MGSLNPRQRGKFPLNWSPPISRSSATAAAAMAAETVPVEFICPISSSLMADPVVVTATGRTYERSCIQACFDLAVAPPGLLSSTSLSSYTYASLFELIPNVALKSAIINWCDRRGLPRPHSVLPEAAREFARDLDPTFPPYGAADQNNEVARATALAVCRRKDEASSGMAYSHCGVNEKVHVFGDLPQRNGSIDEEDDAWETKSRRSDQYTKKQMSPKTDSPLLFTRESKSCSSSSCRTFSSSYADVPVHEIPKPETPEAAIFPPSDISPTTPKVEEKEIIWQPSNPSIPASPKIYTLEEKIIAKTKDSDVTVQESAVVTLRQVTRESRDSRVILCTPRLLGALRPMLQSRCIVVQVNAAAAAVNLSLEPENRIQMVRYGAMLPLVDVLKSGHAEAREHAAAAVFSLTLEGENRVPIGSLGVIPPLLNLLASPEASPRARRDAGKALYYLSVVGPNRPKIARSSGAVQMLLAVAAETAEGKGEVLEVALPEQSTGLPRLAMRVISNIAACAEGRSALIDSGAVSTVTELMRVEAAMAAGEQYLVAALYAMSRDRLRFRALAKAAGTETELTRVAEVGGGDTLREMAEKTLWALRSVEELV